jgi:aryl-alcohol dehydrogenase-like predicted oxidoreductase
MTSAPLLDYRPLGRSGLRVSDLALGTMTFGASTGWGVPPETASELYAAYRDAGGNYLDTANQYAGGESERLVGRLIAGHRDEIVLATKYSNAAPGTDANAGGNQRKNMMRSIDESLARLGTDHVDLYVVHSWDLITPLEEVMRAFDDLVRMGKVLHVGVSNTPAWAVATANTLAELRGWSRYVGLQIEYSLLARTVERELLPMAEHHGLSVLAWSPLKNGVLTGKYRGDTAPEGSRLRAAGPVAALMNLGDPFSPQARRVVEEVAAVADELEATPGQVALSWLRHRPVHVVPIVGASTRAQLEANLASAALRPSAEQLARLDAVSAVPAGYPHEYLASETARSFRSGGLADRIRP